LLGPFIYFIIYSFNRVLIRQRFRIAKCKSKRFDNVKCKQQEQRTDENEIL